MLAGRSLGDWIGPLLLAVAVLLAAAAATWLVARDGGDRDDPAAVDRGLPPGAAAAALAWQLPDAIPVPPARPPRATESRAAAPVAESEPEPRVEPSPVFVVRSGERVGLRAEPGGEVVETLEDETEFGSRTVLSVDRRRGRWAGFPTAHLPNGRLGWVRVDPDRLRAGRVAHEVVVDLSARRARLLRETRVVRSWPVTIGMAGAATPTGHFSVTDLFEGGLNPAYGCCAVALSATQPDLPSGWPGGDLIAIHGTSGPLGVRGSHGCIRSADRDVRALVHTVPLGTPVTIGR